MVKIDSQFEHLFSFTQEDVEAFAKVTGDNNPVHLDESYAAKTMFKRPIMHGMLGAAVFSKVFGTMFPGEGTIYLSQSLSFLKPMYVSENYKIEEYRIASPAYNLFECYELYNNEFISNFRSINNLKLSIDLYYKSKLDYKRDF